MKYDEKRRCWLIGTEEEDLKHGGEGSGNFEHEGRPGEVGGSAPGGGSVYEKAARFGLSEKELKDPEFLRTIERAKIMRRGDETYPGRQIDLDPNYKSTPDEVKEVQAKFRRGPGEGKNLREYRDITEVQTVLCCTKYALISAGRNGDLEKGKEVDDPDFLERHFHLKQDLEAKGYKYVEVEGKYTGGTEDSFLVMAHDPDTKEILAMGAKYNQNSVIIGDQGKAWNIYTTGKDKGKFNAIDVGAPRQYENVEASKTDNYTRVPLHGNKYARFSLNIDFGKTYGPGEKSP